MHGMEETLHRRERIQVLEPGMGLGETLETGLVDARQRKVRRRKAARFCRVAVIDEPAKRVDEAVGNALDRLSSMQRLAEDEARLEPAVPQRGSALRAHGGAARAGCATGRGIPARNGTATSLPRRGRTGRDS